MGKRGGKKVSPQITVLQALTDDIRAAAVEAVGAAIEVLHETTESTNQHFPGAMRSLSNTTTNWT